MANPTGPVGPGSVGGLGPNLPRIVGPQGPSTPGRLESPQAPLGATLPGYSAPTEARSELNARDGAPGADLVDRLAAWVARLFGPPAGILPSAAPGGGPSAEREGPPPRGAGGRAPRSPVGGGTLGAMTGYGGHGDPVATVEAEAYTRDQLHELVTRTRASRLRDPLRSRVRFQIPFSQEGHNRDGWRLVVGPWSMLDGTTTAPSAGNSTQTVPIALPANTAGPFALLDRYPGPLYVLVFLRRFGWMPLGTAMTGYQELYFTDIGGAVAAMGIYNAAVSSNGLTNVEALCNTPITDPGNAALGQINVVNIGIGGTPVASRYQLSLGYVAMAPDPFFSEHRTTPPTPADLTQALRELEVGGDLTHTNGRAAR